MSGEVKDYLHVKDQIRVKELRDIGNAGGTIKMNAGLNFGEVKDITFGTATGTKIGTAANNKLAFHGSTPIVQQTGVAVTAAGVHAALVNLGLITA